MTVEPPPAPPQPPGTTDPYPNKAIVAAIITLVTVFVQLAASDWDLSLEQEGITAIGGAVATLLVYAVSNWRRLGR